MWRTCRRRRRWWSGCSSPTSSAPTTRPSTATRSPLVTSVNPQYLTYGLSDTVLPAKVPAQNERSWMWLCSDYLGFKWNEACKLQHFWSFYNSTVKVMLTHPDKCSSIQILSGILMLINMCTVLCGSCMCKEPYTGCRAHHMSGYASMLGCQSTRLLVHSFSGASVDQACCQFKLQDKPMLNGWKAGNCPLLCSVCCTGRQL